MWITQQITVRTLVWLAAVAIPFQGLPSATCGCTTVDIRSHYTKEVQSCCASSLIAATKSSSSCCSQPRAGRCPCTGANVCRCDETSSCCQQRLACCSVEVSSDSSCLCGTGCQCGDDCRCGDNNVPAEPAVPPVENNSSERILAASAGTASLVTFYLPSVTRRHLELYAGANPPTALGCCVALCRFTL